MLIKIETEIEVKIGIHFAFDVANTGKTYFGVFTDENFLVRCSRVNEPYVVHELKFAMDKFKYGTWVMK